MNGRELTVERETEDDCDVVILSRSRAAPATETVSEFGEVAPEPFEYDVP